MTHQPRHRAPRGLVAGRSHADDLALLTAGYETGWWDDHGQPAPWPEDFFDDDTHWHPTGSEGPAPEPGQPPF